MTDPTPTRDEAVPTGWKLVPVEPTDDMLAAGDDAMVSTIETDNWLRHCRNAWEAMLASAPAPASGGVDAVRVLNDNGKRWRVESADGRWEMKPTGHIDADEARRLCERIAAALSASANAVAVKPLPWVQVAQDHWQARVLNFKYVVVSGRWWEDRAGYVSADIGNDAAKAAAQADYEQRIRSALSPAATPVSEAEPVAWRWRSAPGRQWHYTEDLTDIPAKLMVSGEWVQPEVRVLSDLAKPASSPAGGGMDLIRTLVIPMVRERSREPGDAWHQAEQVLASLSQSTSAGRVGE